MDGILRQAIAFFLFAGAWSAFGQSADGKLKVTATVLTSVSLVIDADGTERILIANASDPADNVSSLVSATLGELNAKANHGSTGQASKPAGSAEAWNHKRKRKPDSADRTTLYQRSVQHREH